MKIILDTNVFLVSISSKSKYHWIFEGLQKAEYTLCVTTEILAEYAEIIENHMGSIASQSALGVIENLPNIAYINTYYRFNLLSDPDDNKFVDCFIASNADYLVSHDRDFNVLSTLDFPPVKVIDAETFRMMLLK